MSHPLALLAVLALVVVFAELLVRHTVARHAGTALLGILLTALLANMGVIPAGSTADAPVPVYDAIFEYVAPLAIFWLILGVNIRHVLRAGVPMVALFLAGAAGTAAGALLAVRLLGGTDVLGAQQHAIAGMFTGTYIGGSINFNAVALEYDVVRDGSLYVGSIVADNIITAVWMVITLLLPRVVAPLFRGVVSDGVRADGPLLGIEDDTEAVHPIDLGLMLALGFGALVGSQQLTAWLAARDIGVPFMLVLSTVALLLAQVPAVTRLRGARVLGMFAVYLFLNVIGAFCDVRALGALGTLGVRLLAFASVIVCVHGVVTVLAARVLRLEPDLAAVASQANVGGGTSALALARSLGRADLVLPAVLVGSLGNAVGNFLAFWVAATTQ
ncbi:MAG TPA: DUF819 family protein [Gemmatimonadaceae bacterium]|nr:DUF819 family protein [Gemmatimonadaceae bacterium]